MKRLTANAVLIVSLSASSCARSSRQAGGEGGRQGQHQPASLAELRSCRGSAPQIAQRILDFRKRTGISRRSRYSQGPGDRREGF